MNLILASSSPWRKQLLERLRIPFTVEVPDIDESPLPDEDMHELVSRLSVEKAMVIAEKNPDSCVIGSDLLVGVNGQMLGKPKTVANGRKYLQLCSDQVATALTGMAIIANGQIKTYVIPTEIKFKELSDELIDLYIRLDDPLQCAGGIKADYAGSLLFEWIHSDDPSALIGLPLITLANELLELGFYAAR
jgi:MAF protein